MVKTIDSSSTLTVLGTLVAQGTAAAPAVFTSIADDSAGGDTNGDGTASSPSRWGGIAFQTDPQGPTGTVVFDHVDFRNGWIEGGTAASVSMTNSMFTDAFRSGINAGGDIEFRSNTVSGSLPYVGASWNTGSVQLSTPGTLTVSDNHVTGAGGLSGFGAAGTTITGNTITGTLPWSGGISSWNSSVSPTDGPVTVMNNTVTGAAGDAVQVRHHLRPSQLTGNTGSTNSRNVMVLSRRLEARPHPAGGWAARRYRIRRDHQRCSLLADPRHHHRSWGDVDGAGGGGGQGHR
ncbi:MAG: right-handed parallel beta-helix repeat-containing protein [Actinomycetales bacterium]|nr:right-handed parallel beta-helix repeat-containing protein [Actinomycetales bacterium]